jgi:threonine synthase
MCEGGTPLVKAPKLSKLANVNDLYVKFEGANPTGSFKDRGMTIAITIAKYLGIKAVACASTGNTSSSMSAYARRAGIEPIIVLPEKGIAKGKMSQSALYGATTIIIKGNFDDALRVILEAQRQGIIYPVNSVNPWRLEGQKTVGFEIIDELGIPDWIALPVGNAGNITALWKGLLELKRFQLIDKLPKLLGVQAKGAAPIVKMFEDGLNDLPDISNPKTIASAIKIGRPVNWRRAVRAIKGSGGHILAVTDDEILNAQRLIARLEGLGVEPASASSIAGIMKARDEGIIDNNECIVAIATGHVLKDPDISSSHPHSKLIARDSDHALSLLTKIIAKRSPSSYVGDRNG